MYIIGHRIHIHAYISECVFPPRLCEWTDDIRLAQKFEFKREAQAAAEYINTAWFVEIIDYDTLA